MLLYFNMYSLLYAAELSGVSISLKNAEILHFIAKIFVHIIFLLYFCSRKRLLSACGSLPASGCIPFILIAIQRHRGKAKRMSYVKSGV